MIRLHWVLLLAACVAASAQDKTPLEWNGMGLAASERNDFPEAERCYTKAIDAWAAMGMPFDAYRATALVNLGQTQSVRGDRHKGAKAFEQAVALYKNTFGLENERTINAINLLAATNLMLGESARAEELLNQILPIERQYFAGGLQLARTLTNLAIMYTSRRLPERAILLIDEALQIAIATEGEESPDVALDYTVAAEAHRVAGHYDRALPLYRRSRSIYEKNLGADHTRVASILGQEGLILMHDGKLALADRNMTRALEIITRQCPGCVIEQWVAEANLGMLRFKQKRYAEADSLLSHALDLQERVTLHPGADMVSTMQALAKVREKLHRPDEAARLNARANMLLTLR